MAANRSIRFVCFHGDLHSMDEVDWAIREGRSIEIDALKLSRDFGAGYHDDVVVGHDPISDIYWNHAPKRQETMMRAVEVVDRVVGTGTFVKFDIKSVDTLGWVEEQAKRLKPEQRMLHAFVSEVRADAIMGPSVERLYQDGPQTVFENVPLERLREMKEHLDGIPIQVSCRGFTVSELMQAENGRFPIIDQLCERIIGVAEVLNFNVKNMPLEAVFYVWKKYGLMVERNIDAGEGAPYGVPFLGRSDKMEEATIIG